MSSIVGGDFFENSGVVAPRGIVSVPPRDAVCAARLKPVEGTKLKLTSAMLISKCQQLYVAVEEQALTYLIQAQWAVEIDAELGLHVTTAEVQQEFHRLAEKYYPTEAALHTYLGERGWSLSDELFLIKKDLLTNKLSKKLQAGGQGFGKYVVQAEKRWTARTSCRKAYAVSQCRETAAPSANAPSANMLIEEITGR